jgi:hypothetical protein
MKNLHTGKKGEDHRVYRGLIDYNSVKLCGSL